MSNLRLEITGKAYLDIEQITDYIAQDKPNAAHKMAKLFYNTFIMLQNSPALGTTRHDYTNLDVKFWVVKKNYLVVYKVINDETLRILRVLTSYQDVCSKL
ncbi:type II toxin-antitoxin system RelE/ParE family toxin [bacterium]|nr:type II toxin-antitoxin system RelE/ParE family toxin [bacterium]